VHSSDLAVVFALTVVAAVVFDLAWRVGRSRHRRGFPCFYCKKQTPRRDGYCCDEHRDEDLRTAGFEADT